MATDPYAKFKNFRMSAHYPLCDFMQAPDSYGFYEIGMVHGAQFKPMYGGRSAGTTLRQRLKKHFDHSHNDNIADAKGPLYFRYYKTNSDADARFVEALNIAAMEYDWNKRQEWRQHWALEA
jgi:hypothetical protein